MIYQKSIHYIPLDFLYLHPGTLGKCIVQKILNFAICLGGWFFLPIMPRLIRNARIPDILFCYISCLMQPQNMSWAHFFVRHLYFIKQKSCTFFMKSLKKRTPNPSVLCFISACLIWFKAYILAQYSTPQDSCVLLAHLALYHPLYPHSLKYKEIIMYWAN